MTIILNEKEYAEECLKNKIIDDKPFLSLSIIAKYYYHYLGYRKKKITELLTEFISKYYPRYDCNKTDWDNNIEKIASNVGKYTLYEIDGVWITKSELSTIENIHNKVLERLAFTMLCLGKLSNLKNPNNQGWVNHDVKEIFSLARISCSVTNRYEKIGLLNQLGLLEFPKKNDNLSSRITFIDDNSEKVLFINDFRELGYEYLKYKGENFIRCRECEVLVRNNKSGTKKYCSECAKYTPQETKLLICIDCEEEFSVPGNNKRTIRCPCCQENHIREYDRLRKSNR